MIDINSAWEELKRRVENCTKCGLCKTRKKTVLGEGRIENCTAVIIGEAPGHDEDIQGRPFVGKAGQKLTEILQNGGKIPRDSVYIMNTVKCHPPGTDRNDRPPTKQEQMACNEFLEAQLLLLSPKIVVTLGTTSTQWLLKTQQKMSELRGKWVNWRGIELLPMFHPSFLLRDQNKYNNAEDSPRYLTWLDVKSLKAKIDEIEKN